MLNKKRDRKKIKKNQKKKNLLEKYKDEISQNINLEGKSTLNLIKNKKVKNLDIEDDDILIGDNNIDGEKIYAKDNLLLHIIENKPKFKSASKDILEFTNKHFYGGRIKRTKLNKILYGK
jgi:hypothetical protein